MRAARLPDHGNSVWIAAKDVDMSLYPAQCRDLIKQTEIARKPTGYRKKAERAQPIIDADYDNAVSCRQIAAVIPRQRARTTDEAAAVNPDDHWCLLHSIGRGPNVQAQAILVLRQRNRTHRPLDPQWRLRRDRSVGGGVAHPPPWDRRLRRQEAVRPERRRCIRNSAKRYDAAFRAFHCATNRTEPIYMTHEVTHRHFYLPPSESATVIGYL